MDEQRRKGISTHAHRGSVSRAMWSAWLTAVNRFTAFAPPPPPSFRSAAGPPLPLDKHRRPTTAAQLPLLVLATSLNAFAAAIGIQESGVGWLSCALRTAGSGSDYWTSSSAHDAALLCLYFLDPQLRVTWRDKLAPMPGRFRQCRVALLPIYYQKAVINHRVTDSCYFYLFVKFFTFFF